MTLTVEEMAAGDVAKGQRWVHVTGRPTRGDGVWQVTAIDADGDVHVRRGKATKTVSMGQLLAYWQIVA